jgi:hypothetical protein
MYSYGSNHASLSRSCEDVADAGSAGSASKPCQLLCWIVTPRHATATLTTHPTGTLGGAQPWLSSPSPRHLNLSFRSGQELVVGIGNCRSHPSASYMYIVPPIPCLLAAWTAREGGKRKHGICAGCTPRVVSQPFTKRKNSACPASSS